MYFYGTISAQRQVQNLTVSHLSERARPASHKPTVSIEDHGGPTSLQTVITRLWVSNVRPRRPFSCQVLMRRQL